MCQLVTVEISAPGPNWATQKTTIFSFKIKHAVCIFSPIHSFIMKQGISWGWPRVEYTHSYHLAWSMCRATKNHSGLCIVNMLIATIWPKDRHRQKKRQEKNSFFLERSSICHPLFFPLFCHAFNIHWGFFQCWPFLASDHMCPLLPISTFGL